ncbi:Oidioi.mRNA.OKI2018_I69.chr1.g3650.t1.cds [Oikopleura dioica]|uniref:Oidioi.mRNA.OKI2018_I69.chr1.g3650.t1.cds n=1 Tax=Oikopleura dioica TaxID=34765 RepID=A0ABN7T410_OIKDI|nr:Oidioi.mRNA.OKI2018_I69.chr1.g3650.t1.cds [Oikopleura dioica]
MKLSLAFAAVASGSGLYGGFRNRRFATGLINPGLVKYKRNYVETFLDNGLDVNLDDFLDYMSACEKKVLATVAASL